MSKVKYSQYDPMIVEDEHGNKYLCLNIYETERVMQLMHHLQKYHSDLQLDTGDWWLDVPAKIARFLKAVKNES